MADWKKKCTKCGEDIEYGKFGPCKKQPGLHTAPVETYYHPGARDFQDPSLKKAFSPQIILVPSYSYRDEQTQKDTKTTGVSVQFYFGKYETENPEEQYHLDRKHGIESGAEGRKMWEGVYLSPQQQVDIAKAQLAALQNQISDSNELLASVKAKQVG